MHAIIYFMEVAVQSFLIENTERFHNFLFLKWETINKNLFHFYHKIVPGVVFDNFLKCLAARCIISVCYHEKYNSVDQVIRQSSKSVFENIIKIQPLVNSSK